MKKIKFIAILGIIGALVGASAASNAQTAGETLEAGRLWRSFQESPAEAEKMIGHNAVVTGIVVDKGISIYLTPNVSLADEDEGPVRVICVLPRDEYDTLDSYHIGRRVTMSGRIYRATEKAVVLKQCAPLISSSPAAE